MRHRKYSFGSFPGLSVSYSGDQTDRMPWLLQLCFKPSVCHLSCCHLKGECLMSGAFILKSITNIQFWVFRFHVSFLLGWKKTRSRWFIHPFSIHTLPSSGSQGSWTWSQLPPGERWSTAWTGYQSITACLHRPPLLHHNHWPNPGVLRPDLCFMKLK